MNTATILAVIKKKEMAAFLIALCCTFILFPVFFEMALYPLANDVPTWWSLDPSWQITLNKINIDRITWGSDFSFTYGPLSYLSTRVGWGTSKYSFVFFDLFMSFNFFYIFYTSYLYSRSSKTTLLLIIAATILIPVYFGAGTALLLSAFLLFWIRKSLDGDNPLYYIMQLLVIVLVFFIKFNTGLVSFVFFFTGIGYKALFTKQNKLLLTVYALAPVVVIYLLSFVLHVSLPGYLKGGLEMVSGYNEIMYLNESYPNEFRFALVVIAIAVCMLVQKTWLQRQYPVKNLVIFFLFSSTLYILYKQAFTRFDIQHIQEFYKFILLFILCIPDFHFTPIGKNSTNLVIVMVFITIFFNKKREEHIFELESRVKKSDYISGLQRFTDTSGLFLFPNNNQLPQRIKTKIGNSSIDIFPWNIRLLFENKLRYTARPVFQSYTAYTPYLENLNFNFYNSAKAPQFVIYEYETIDGRYPLFDETKVNLLLLKHYTCVDTFSFGGRPHLVLERNRKPAKLSFEKIKEYDAGLSDLIVPKPGRYYEVLVSNTLKGKAVAFLDHSPELSLVVKTRDGNQNYYRTSKKLLETGIFSDHFFNSTLNFYNFIKIDSAGVSGDVMGYFLQPANPSLFKDRIKVIEYKIN